MTLPSYYVNFPQEAWPPSSLVLPHQWIVYRIAKGSLGLKFWLKKVKPIHKAQQVQQWGGPRTNISLLCVGKYMCVYDCVLQHFHSECMDILILKVSEFMGLPILRFFCGVKHSQIGPWMRYGLEVFSLLTEPGPKGQAERWTNIWMG
jgi:hypothetical protein